MGYKVKVGLEMHCEISETNTKVFSSAKNSYSVTPNENIRPVDMAFPGILPVVNKEDERNRPKYVFHHREHNPCEHGQLARTVHFRCLAKRFRDIFQNTRINQKIHIRENELLTIYA